MRFKIDENLPIECAQLLANAGHDAMTVLDQGLGGEDDRILADVIQREQRVLVTLDLDFADIRAYPPNEYPGLIVFRLARQDKKHVLGVMTRLIAVLGDDSTKGALWIVDEDRIRIRG